jgi:hypothetical protein
VVAPCLGIEAYLLTGVHFGLNVTRLVDFVRYGRQYLAICANNQDGIIMEGAEEQDETNESDKAIKTAVKSSS